MTGSCVHQISADSTYTYICMHVRMFLCNTNKVAEVMTLIEIGGTEGAGRGKCGVKIM